jgi:phage terminase Nu1 subunit (DNA packaging protein)
MAPKHRGHGCLKMNTMSAHSGTRRTRQITVSAPCPAVTARTRGHGSLSSKIGARVRVRGQGSSDGKKRAGPPERLYLPDGVRPDLRQGQNIPKNLRMKKTPSNKLIAWSLTAAAVEFGHDRITIRRKLSEAGEQPDAKGHFTARQICAALFGNVYAEKLRLSRAQAEAAERKNARESGRVIALDVAIDTCARVVGALSQKFRSSSLSLAEQRSFLIDLRALRDVDFRTLPLETLEDDIAELDDGTDAPTSP